MSAGLHQGKRRKNRENYTSHSAKKRLREEKEAQNSSERQVFKSERNDQFGKVQPLFSGCGQRVVHVLHHEHIKFTLVLNR